MAYNPNKKARIKDVKALALCVKDAGIVECTIDAD